MARRPFLDKLIGEKASPQSNDKLVQVIRNLEAILNTQEGYGYFVRGFGLGEYTGKRGTSALVKTLLEEIQDEIQRNEPRLRDVELTLIGRGSRLWLQFDLVAMMGETQVKLHVFFDTVSSRVRVQREE